MVVMKHLLQPQQAGRPGSPPAWKCHDRSLWLTPRRFCKGSRKATVPSSGNQALAHSVFHTASHHPHPTALSPSMGNSRCRQRGQQAEGPGHITSPCSTQDRCCPTQIPIHPWQEWEKFPTFRKLFKPLIVLSSKAHTWLFPADVNLGDRPSSLQPQI